MTGSIFHKLMLIGINSILQLFSNWSLHRMFPYFTKDRCQPDRTIIIWVVPFTISKYYHNISFFLVSIKCPYSCICVYISLSIWLPSQWSDILADNAHAEIHIENDTSRSKERDVSNKSLISHSDKKVSSLLKEIHPLSQCSFLPTTGKGWGKLCSLQGGQAIASEEKLTENNKNARDGPESHWLMYSWKAPSEEEGTQTQLE